jgi:AraC-like DNA-binding protein
MLSITLANAHIVAEQHWPYFTEYLIGLTTGPLIWLTVQRLQSRTISLAALHFIPATLFIIQQLFFPEIVHWPILIVMLHLQGYALAALTNYLNISTRQLSCLFKKYYKWAAWLIAFYLFIGLSQWVRFIFADHQNLNLIIPMTASLHLYLVVMVGFNRSALWKGLDPAKKKRIHQRPPDNMAVEHILEKVRHGQYYLQEGLTIGRLAVRLDMPAHDLSHLLNQTIDGGFVTYINQLRVQHAQSLLTDPAYHHLSMEGIGKESGFQSRSAFYHYFKKECQITPSAYQKKMSGISKSGQEKDV